ncbi:MAG TPA: site-2 protease family protein [Candidatus Polarisedimenticolia bacterium]|jgi:membrane-associated protease RseP (regulator of RpoE activity)|nr:site-2 protease family protein [Candidatus Polarisedimenticolia bacterium]
MDHEPRILEYGTLPASSSVPPPSASRPDRARRPFPPSVNVACFLLTVLTTLIAGTLLTLDDFTLLKDVLLSPSLWGLGWPYSASLILILGAHEMGHYVACRMYGIDASLPFFIPGPPLIGTFGALIRIRAPFTSRRALFDIGVAGPIAGFVVALPLLAYGLSLSRLLPEGSRPGGIGFPPCPLLSLALILHYPGIGPKDVVEIHPVVVAVWVGLLATFLNLLPIGQLDGGHVLYALSRRAHRTVSRVGTVLLVVLGVFLGGYHLVVFGVIWAIIGTGHPPVLEEQEGLGAARVVVAVLALLIFLLCVIPTAPTL